MKRLIPFAAVALLCSSAAWSQTTPTELVAFDRPETQPPAGAPPIALASSDLPPDKPMPKEYSFYGKNISPPLAWTAGPPRTKSYVLIVQDPDAGAPSPLVHWLAYDIPSAIRALNHAIRNTPAPTSPLGMLQGWNYHYSVGYTGPRPPVGAPAHHYVFQIYAMDRVLRVRPGAHLEDVIKAMRGHVLARGEVASLYAEPAPQPKPSLSQDARQAPA